MRRPLFFWLRAVTKHYAELHSNESEVKSISTRALKRITDYPLKYYVATHVAALVLEFIVPLCFGYFGRFSHLSREKSLKVLEYLQHTKYITVRIVLVLCKTPVMFSIKPPEFKETI